ncbi:hypothetical protein DID88_002894 [Monilinia fructigena]|uniref:Uncharacterized protein n=1 Tax=Monilinia fructigena TaxID=38457 RepID=A0A395INV6_9HELO|nr:hypothetical protein DID88_002894 [Monilinia fructigena]
MNKTLEVIFTVKDSHRDPNAIASNKKEKMYLPTTTWTWAFMIAATLQAAAVLAIESYVFAKFQTSLVAGKEQIALDRTIPTYLTPQILDLPNLYCLVEI